MKQARCQHRPGGANRVTMGDSAAFDIDDVQGKTEFARHGERNRCEGFVDLDTVQMGQLPACTFQRLMNGGHWAEAEHARFDRAQPIGYQTGHRPQAMSFGIGSLGHHHCGGATVEPRRVSGRDGAVLAEGRVQFCKGRQSGIGTRMLVACEYRRAFLACKLDPYDLALEFPGGLRGGKALLGTLGPAILLFPRESKLVTRSSVCQPEWWPEKASFSPSSSMLS